MTATLVDNILATYDVATAAEMKDGIEWYGRARRIAFELDPTNVDRAAGAIAAMSPLMSWERNVAIIREAYATGVVTGGLYRNCKKAQDILGGANPLDVLKGQKVRAFFLTIANPAHPDAVVVDRHAHDVAVGRVTDDATRSALSRKSVYATFCEAYRTAAMMRGVTPSQMQAVTWTVWRNRNASGWAARDASI